MTTDLDSVLPRIDGHCAAALVAGESRTGARRELPDPATGLTHNTVGWASPQDVQDAVHATLPAAQMWQRTSPRSRSRVLQAIAGDLRNHAGDLTSLIIQETGKRKVEAAGEVAFSAEYFEWFADAATRSLGRFVDKPDRRFLVDHRPVGVVAAVTPWNFPLSIPARKVAAALAAGCPVVLKPSELTPLSALALARIVERHVPSGLVNVVVGDGEEITGALLDHEEVAAVTFTGSTRVGVLVAQRAMGTMTRVTMELGGMAPFIIDEHADLTVALDALMVAKFRNNGASCIAANNVYVHHKLHDQVLEALAARIASLKVGSPADSDTDVGPMLRPEHVDRLAGLVAAAEHTGCDSWQAAAPEQGWFCPPTLVAVSDSVDLWREEIFGPVCAVRSFDEIDEVIEEVNARRTGLAAYIVSTDTERALTTASRLNVGIVGINNGAPNTPEVPFGGLGLAGLGREGGVEGMLEFLETQTISVAR